MSHSSSIKGTQDDPSIGLFLRVQYLSREIQERRQLEEAQYAKLHSNYEYIITNIVAVATNWRQTWLITWRDYFSELQIYRFCRKEVKNVKIHEWRHQKCDKEMKYVHMCHSCHKKFFYRDWTIIWGTIISTKKILDMRVVAKSIMEHVNQWITKDSRSQVKILTLSYVKKRFLPAVIFISTHIGIRRCLRGRFYSAFWDTEDIILDHFRRCNTIHPQIAELARNYLQKL